ncbi:unnamed protein product [Penicillium salamii]|uniref:Uncharacterized protein n=1 Tax=Penicillium salamii TaxID=1612424 RepID=A0A9W4JVU2_9EURO|nr:unnamed protein product [Penicillium salamii]CAG8367713.1 unnamed protein product [Penicillium salamii]CAG8417400.1 unnamed protein product [Penicillium salamii]CAG8418286.1 unnamed protein product [Penicillium salamii]
MESLEQPVDPGDLLLLHGGELVNEAGVSTSIRPYMLLVASIKGNSNDTPTPGSPVSTVDSVTVCGSPISTDSPNKVDPRLDISVIQVRKVPYGITSKNGCWTLDGPDVYYTPQEGETDSSFFSELLGKDLKDAEEEICDEDLMYPKRASIADTHCLGDFMPPGAGVKLMSKFHGRDALRYYFNGCPCCNGTTWICPGCGGISRLWPDIFASCGRDQACPICMGLDIAMEDKSYLDELERLEDIKSGHCSGTQFSADDMDEALSLATERYEALEARHEEMGHLGHESAEKMLQQWKDAF